MMNSVETNVKHHNFAQLNSQFSRIASLYSVRWPTKCCAQLQDGREDASGAHMSLM